MTRHCRAFLLALQFLTTVPVKGSQTLDKPAMGLSVLYYPLIGLLLGLLLWAVASAGLLSFSPLLSATLVVTAWALLTGALHLDGLADCADAWVGGFGSRERTLQLMKDPTSGPIAIVVVVTLLLLKVAVISDLLSRHPDYAMALILAPLLARLAVLALFLSTPYVRKAGLGEILSQYFPRQAARYICLAVAVALLLLDFGAALAVLISLIFSLLVLRQVMMSRLRGCTGDTIGASIEVTEVVCLLAFLAFW